MTLKQLAKETGMSYANLPGYENGRMAVPEKWRPVIAEILESEEYKLFDADGFVREAPFRY